MTNRRLKLILSLVTILFASYHVYIAFYPSDSFYVDEFESNTKITFPKSGNIIIKGASYPDIHGDYSSSAIFSVDENDFHSILNKIKASKEFQLDNCDFSFGMEIRSKSSSFNEENFKIRYADPYECKQSIPGFIIAFDEKNKLITFDRNSW